MKAGNIAAANNIPKGTLGTTTGVGRNAANELSLIDFDPEPTASSASAPPAAGNTSLLEDNTASQSQQTSVEDDLLGLSIGGNASTPGGINLGGSTLTDLFNSTPTTFSQQSYQPPQQQQFTAPSHPPPTTQPRSNYDAFASLSSAIPRSKPATPIPGQRPTQSQDPFSILSNSRPASRPATPSMQSMTVQPAQSAHPTPSNLNNGTNLPADEEWDFVSSPPQPETTPSKSTLTVHDQGKLKVVLECMRQTNQGDISTAPIFVKATYTNLTPSSITDLHFQIAVEKSYLLQLQQQSGKDLASGGAVTQIMLVSNVPAGKGMAVKIRFKASYKLAGVGQEEQGLITSLGIA